MESQYDLFIDLGRKSLAEEYLEEIPVEEEQGDGTWLVMYDFDRKPDPRFWSNLRRLRDLVGEGSMVQYSVFMTRSRRGAICGGQATSAQLRRVLRGSLVRGGATFITGQHCRETCGSAHL